jgi:hypothetical protein
MGQPEETVLLAFRSGTYPGAVYHLLTRPVIYRVGDLDQILSTHRTIQTPGTLPATIDKNLRAESARQMRRAWKSQQIHWSEARRDVNGGISGASGGGDAATETFVEHPNHRSLMETSLGPNDWRDEKLKEFCETSEFRQGEVFGEFQTVDHR